MFSKRAFLTLMALSLVVCVAVTYNVFNEVTVESKIAFDPSSLPPTAAGPGSNGTLDPRGCTTLSDTRLRQIGYEPVTATPNDGQDDTASIQATIDTAFRQRRAVYFKPGTYNIRNTLRLMIEKKDARNNSGYNQYGIMLIGSYCGTEKPEIVMADGVDNRTDEKAVSASPKAMIEIWRDNHQTNELDSIWQTRGGLHYNSTVRNLKLTTGANSGVVALRNMGAEGSSNSELTVDATGGFAGFFGLPASGGYSYDIEVIGGQYGIYLPSNSGTFNGKAVSTMRGGTTTIAGLKLSGQVGAPIATGHYAPLTVAGFDIAHDNGAIVSYISGSRGSWAVSSVLPQLTGGNSVKKKAALHVSLVDGRIHVADETAVAMFRTQGPSIYLRNTYVRGLTKIVDNSHNGDLLVPDSTNWYRISEYSGNGNYNNTYGTPGKQIGGNTTNQQFYAGALYPGDVTANETGTLPNTAISKHLHRVGLCNPEGAGVVFANDHGANPNDTVSDHAQINAAIQAAGADGRVFLPAGMASSNGKVSHYRIRGTINLMENTVLCGATRYSSILDADGWTPSANSPVIRTVNSSQATPVVGDVRIWLPKVTGSQQGGFGKYVYSIDWQSGKGVMRDVYQRSVWSRPGPRNNTLIRNNGGGKVYGHTMQAAYNVSAARGDGSDNYIKNGSSVISSLGGNLLIQNTVNELAFYPLHCQHAIPYRGAQCKIENSSKVRMYGAKTESQSLPSQLVSHFNANSADPGRMPAIVWIKNSNDVALIGHEGLSESHRNRALVEVENSTNVTIANWGIGRKHHWSGAAHSQRYYVETSDGGGQIHQDGHLALFKTALGTVPDVPGSSTGSAEPPTEAPPSTPDQFQFLSSN